MAADRAQQVLGHFDSKKGILSGYVSIITGSGMVVEIQEGETNG